MGKGRTYTLTCMGCGNEFNTTYWQSQFCSKKCRKKASTEQYKGKKALDTCEKMERKREAFKAAYHLHFIRKHLPEEVSRFRRSRAWATRECDPRAKGGFPRPRREGS